MYPPLALRARDDFSHTIQVTEVLFQNGHAQNCTCAKTATNIKYACVPTTSLPHTKTMQACDTHTSTLCSSQKARVRDWYGTIHEKVHQCRTSGTALALSTHDHRHGCRGVSWQEQLGRSTHVEALELWVALATQFPTWLSLQCELMLQPKPNGPPPSCSPSWSCLGKAGLSLHWVGKTDGISKAHAADHARSVQRGRSD